MVNKFNKSMAIGLRYNYDLELTFTCKRAYAIMQYCMQYAVKACVPVDIAVAAVMSLEGM